MRRYVENLFRFKELFLIPLITIPIIALAVAFYLGQNKVISSTIWVEPVETLDLGTTLRETPTETEAKALQERLTTRAFREEVMERVGLTAAIQQGQWPKPSRFQSQIGSVPVLRDIARVLGLMPPQTTQGAMESGLRMIEKSILVTPEGDNLLRVSYRGKDEVLGTRLVQEVIALYNEKTMAIRADQARLGIDFYTRQVRLQEQKLAQASEALRQFLETHPAPFLGQSRPPAEEAELQSLQKDLAVEQTLYESALRKLEEARIAGEAAVSNRSQGFQIIDPAQLDPGAAANTRRGIVMMGLLGVLLGVILGALPIVMLTWRDTTVRSKEDVEEALEVPMLVMVPVVSLGRRREPELVKLALAPRAASGRDVR